jgi:hypothetical protein
MKKIRRRSTEWVDRSFFALHLPEGKRWIDHEEHRDSIHAQSLPSGVRMPCCVEAPLFISEACLVSVQQLERMLSMNTKSTIRTSFFSLLTCVAFASGAVMAQTAPQAAPKTNVAGHPRVKEVNNRLENQQDRIQAGVKDGQLNAKQATRDETRDNNIAARESADQAKHGGHLTKREQRNLNKSLNRDSHQIRHQRKH